ncbi:MAG: hypothetical protein WC356_04335 [Candidatus Micrarchaeia archaeon]|jgi:hypothetical protein
MTTKHTPGPWTLMDEHLQNENTGDDYPMITAWDEVNEVSVTIATACPDADEMYANARLIAAAPELAEQFKTMTEGFEAMRAALAECCIDVQADYHRRGVAILNQYPATVGFDSRALLSRVEGE